LARSSHAYHKYLAIYERRGLSSSKLSLSLSSAPRGREYKLTSICSTNLQFGSWLLHGFGRTGQPYMVELRGLLSVTFSYLIYLSCATTPRGGNQPPILLELRRIHFTTITNPFATDGRRPVYLTVLPIFAMGSLGVALARNVQQLLLFRVVQAFGGGGGMSIGAGVISDIYRLEQRGTAMGVFFAVSETIWTCARSHV
jgi:MFS family permease